jgi:hypothetical protein
MGTVSPIKKEAAAAGAADDPLRAALADAIKQATEAHQAVQRQLVAIEQTRDRAKSRAKDIKKAEEGVERAQREPARETAAGKNTPPYDLRAARRSLLDAQDQAKAASDAIRQLHAARPAVEAEAREADIAVDAAISEILSAHAHAIVGQADEMLRSLLPLKSLCLALIEEQCPPGGADIPAYSRGRAPLEAARVSAARIIGTINAAGAGDHADYWQTLRARLRGDPFCQLAPISPASAA